MEWMFLAFAAGTVVYTIVIVKDYMLDARILNTQLESLLEEREEMNRKIASQKIEQETIAEQIKEVKQHITEFQAIAEKHLVKIRGIEEEMAKRGKYRL